MNVVDNIIQFKPSDAYLHHSIRAFLENHYVSKSTIYKLESGKKLLVNHVFQPFSKFLAEGDLISIDFTDVKAAAIEPYDDQIEIIFEDEDLVILNKPVQLLVHTDGNTIDTLTNRLASHYAKKGYPYPVLPVHRIDLDTSGMVIFAKHPLSHSYLSHLFESQNIIKIYTCLCQYPFKERHGIIKTNIGSDRHSNRQIISPNGQTALTKFQVIGVEEPYSRVSVEIKGGRKHQIRVHMASIGHPIVGDSLYGHRTNGRMMLHFSSVEFIHPRTLKTFQMTCPAPF
jgi:23S rRNA pseudouridine1911/1915/1917 synthase